MPGYALIVIVLAALDDLWIENRTEIIVIAALAIAGIVSIVASYQ